MELQPTIVRRSHGLPPWGFWAVGFALALLLDQPVARLMAPHIEYVKHNAGFFEEAKEMGEYWFTIVVAIILFRLHAWGWKASALLLLSGGLSGLINSTMKWVVGRTRPIVGVHPFSFEPFTGGLSGLFHQKNLCFPSGHAALAFSTAAALAYFCPRGRWLWYTAATLTGIERIAENAHYTSDVVGAAIVGIVSFQLVLRFGQAIDARQNQVVSR